MQREFDPGYGAEPFLTLCREYPGGDVYPIGDFRVEWGPIFHRGRLDGSARLLVIGQDPAAHEAVTRRVLVGTAGQRLQGFMARLGLDRSYVIINTFLYSVYGQGGGQRHQDDPLIAAYRHRWLDALMLESRIQAVVTLGGLADAAWRIWIATPAAAGVQVAYARMTHPTQPEGSAGTDRTKLAEATARLLVNWNAALDVVYPAITAPDTPRRLRHYGTAWTTRALAPVPERDLPAGLPEWMRGGRRWSRRVGATTDEKRRTLSITVPPSVHFEA
ncbi:MAG: uracil-DNA glycosylase family protein [Gemmatimonadota bacterium]